MQSTVNKKHNVPAKMKEFSEKGYNVYVTVDMAKLEPITRQFMFEARQKLKHEAFVDYYVLTHIISKYSNMMQCNSSAPDPLNELLSMVDLVDERHIEDIKKYANHTLNSSSIVDKLFEMNDDSHDSFHSICSDRINGEISKFELRDDEIEWFNLKFRTSYASKSWGLSVNLIHNTNILTLLNMYRDDVLIMPTRKPTVWETLYPGYSLHNPDNESRYMSFDAICVGFKSREVAELFVNKLHILNSCDVMTIHIMNPLSVKINDTLSEKQYGVFLSKRTNPIRDNIGFITLTHDTLTVNTNGDEVTDDGRNESIAVVNDFIDSYYGKIKKMCDRYSVDSPILEVSSRPGWINRGTSISDYVVHRKITRDVKKAACMVSSSQFTTNVNDRIKRYLVNAYSRSHYNMHAIHFLIHIPITDNTDIDAFSKLMNYLTLTQVVNLNETTLMLLPYCMDNVSQEKIYEMMDALS